MSVSSLWHPVVGTCWNKAPLAQSGQPAVSAAAPWKWGPQALHNRIQQVLLWKNVSRCESPDSQIILYSTIVEISIFHSIPFYSIDYLQELHLSSCRIGTFCVRCFLLTSATTSCHIQQETARPTLATLLMPQTKEVTRFCPSCPWLDMAYQRL